MRRRVRMVDLAREVCHGSIVGRRVAVLGAAFKPDSDDVRDSPALSVAAQMQLQGAHVTVTDPQAIANARAKWPDLHFADTALEAARGADVVLLATEWAEYRDARPRGAGRGRRAPADARRAQRARAGSVACGGLDVPGARSSLTGGSRRPSVVRRRRRPASVVVAASGFSLRKVMT